MFDTTITTFLFYYLLKKFLKGEQMKVTEFQPIDLDDQKVYQLKEVNGKGKELS